MGREPPLDSGACGRIFLRFVQPVLNARPLAQRQGAFEETPRLVVGSRRARRDALQELEKFRSALRRRILRYGVGAHAIRVSSRHHGTALGRADAVENERDRVVVACARQRGESSRSRDLSRSRRGIIARRFRLEKNSVRFAKLYVQPYATLSGNPFGRRRRGLTIRNWRACRGPRS